MLSQRQKISVRTGLVGVIGHPIGHSLSPRIHNAAFEAQGLDMVYLAFDVPPEQLANAFAGIRALQMRGVNVTIPHKEAVMTLLDDVDSLAAKVGAVNTVVSHDGKLVGYNTDVTGFTRALRSVLPRGASGLRCVVAGAGGAARAVLAALVADGADTVYVYNRTRERAVILCRAAAEWGPTACEVVDVETLRLVANDCHLFVNTTSVGLASEVKNFPMPVDILHSGLVVVDLVYRERPTAFVQASRERGARVVNGTEMLLMQAGDSYRLWTGLEPPGAVMRESIERAEE